MQSALGLPAVTGSPGGGTSFRNAGALAFVLEVRGDREAAVGAGFGAGGDLG